MDSHAFTRTVVVMLAAAIAPLNPALSQTLSNMDRARGHIMLKTIKAEITRDYYDPTFHGIDLEARFKTADEKIDQATSNGQLFGVIAQTLIDFDDSHLFFIPPPRAVRTDYGWQYQAVSDKVYVVAVKPGSDAESKGLAPGDLINQIDGFQPTRDNVWKLHYLYEALRPKPGMRLNVQSPDGKERQLDVLAKLTESKKRVDLTTDADLWGLFREEENEQRLRRPRYEEVGEAFIWKMPRFNDDRSIDDMMKRAKGRKAIILDLRGNAGGYVDTLTRLVGYYFERDVKIGDVKGRTETKPMIAKTRGGGAYKGEVVVIIDSASGSAAEIFARVIQLEKRGKLIGDRSAGAVMRAKYEGLQVGVDTIVPYGLSITDADIIMTDGKSLEHTGVLPDEVVLPTGADLAARRDPVLAYAAKLVGVNIDPQKAGSMFPIEWRK